MKKLLLFTFALFLWTGAWADKTIYLNPAGFSDNNGKNWASDNAVFVAYVANNDDSQSAWIDMTETETINGATCYKAVIADTYTKLVLVRDGDRNHDWTIWNQTQDIALSGVADNTLFTITGWDNDNSKSGYTTGVTYTAKFVTNASWTNMYAYAWTGELGSETKYLGEWPGKSMSPTGETYGTTSNQIYSIKFTATAIPAKIIFNDGTNGGAVGTNQTTDLVFGDNELYVVPIALPSDPSIAEKRVLTITGRYGEKADAYAADGMDKTTVLSGRNVYHAATPSANSRIEGIGIGGLATKQLEKLHLAVWAKESVENAKIQVYSGGWQSATKNLTGGQWNVFDIALDEFSSPLVDAYALKVVNESGAALGTEIYITDVFFYNEGSKPMLTASIVSHTGTSVDIKMSSYKSASATTDAISYTIAWTGDGNKVVNKANGDEFTETIDGLTQGNTYTFSITAKDDNNVVSDAKELTVTLTVPPTSVPYPSQDNSNVISVYSQKFGDITGLTYGGDWTNTEEVIDGSKTRKIEKLVWGNFAFTPTDMSTMEKLHFDVYPMENMPQIGLRLQGPSIDSKKGHKEVLAAGTWNSFDIDISEFELKDEQLQNINNIQIVSDINGGGGNINGDGTGSFYIGNVYFWKEAASDVVKPVMVSAALESKTHNSATLTLNATDDSGKVMFHIEDATNGVDVTTNKANSGVDYVYTLNDLNSNTSYSFTITALDASGKTSDNSKDVNVTTDVAPAVVLLAEGTGTTGTDGGGSAGLEYSYRIVQTGGDVTATFTCTNSESYTGLNPYIWDNTNGFVETGGNTKKMTYSVGTEIRVACKWAYENGMSVTPDINYVVKDAEANASIAAACNDGKATPTYYSTYSNRNAFVVPADVTVSEMGVDANGKLSIVAYNTDDVVPANTGVLISSSTAGTPEFKLTGEAGTSVLGANNRLRGTSDGIDASTMAANDDNCLFYRLTMHNGTDLGFWWGAAEGAAFAVAANKAYLAIPNDLTGAKDGFNIVGLDDEGETDGINKVNTLVETGVRYNLAGQRVGNDYKGIVIVNGRKVVIK